MLRPINLTLVSVLLFGVLGISAVADEKDDQQVVGALWTFSMTSRTEGSLPLYGMCRAAGRKLYQESKPDNSRSGKPPVPALDDIDKVIGETTMSKRKVVRLRIDDLQATDTKRQSHSGMQGRLELQYQNDDEWFGRFTDSAGVGWEFRCRRYRG